VTLGGGFEDASALESPCDAVDAVPGVISGAAVAALPAVDPHLALLIDHGVMRTPRELIGRGLSPRHAIRAVLYITYLANAVESTGHPHLVVEYETCEILSG
jgi:hypothetical protein